MPLERIADMKKMLDLAIASVRRISTDLRPLILDDLGFSEAVAWHVAELAKRTDLNIQVDMPAKEWVSDTATATALFRIVQESLTNVLRHAQARNVNIALTTHQDSLCLCIQDDGVGMPEKIRVGGIGLVSMRERVNSLGGEFSITSASESKTHPGLRLEVRLPLHVEELGAAL